MGPNKWKMSVEFYSTDDSTDKVILATVETDDHKKNSLGTLGSPMTFFRLLCPHLFHTKCSVFT